MGNVLGLVFANMHDMTVGDLTKNRTMGSILFGGRYRLIDFPLSNMVNSGITNVGVITLCLTILAQAESGILQERRAACLSCRRSEMSAADSTEDVSRHSAAL